VRRVPLNCLTKIANRTEKRPKCIKGLRPDCKPRRLGRRLAQAASGYPVI